MFQKAMLLLLCLLLNYQVRVLWQVWHAPPEYNDTTASSPTVCVHRLSLCSLHAWVQKQFINAFFESLWSEKHVLKHTKYSMSTKTTFFSLKKRYIFSEGKQGVKINEWHLKQSCVRIGRATAHTVSGVNRHFWGCTWYLQEDRQNWEWARSKWRNNFTSWLQNVPEICPILPIRFFGMVAIYVDPHRIVRLKGKLTSGLVLDVFLGGKNNNSNTQCCLGYHICCIVRTPHVSIWAVLLIM